MPCTGFKTLTGGSAFSLWRCRAACIRIACRRAAMSAIARQTVLASVPMSAIPSSRYENMDGKFQSEIFKLTNLVRIGSTALRTFIKSIVLVALIISALMIVAPRLWVKNKKSLLTYNGRISEQIKLFHGRNGAVLFYLPE